MIISPFFKDKDSPLDDSVKEECENEKIGEYSLVLHRQSERLKKLIDDLMEASKVSTGNVEVFLAPCNASRRHRDRLRFSEQPGSVGAHHRA